METPDPGHNPNEIVARGKAIYDRDIRSQIEIPENIGKVLVVDVETSDYLVAMSMPTTITK